MLRKLNFKAIFFLFVLVLPLTLSGVEIWAEGHETADDPEGKVLKFATWNIERFGSIKRGEDDLDNIVEILSEYDFIVITELMDKDIQRLVDGTVEGPEESHFITILNSLPDYGHRVSPIAGPGYNGNESYAFLFKKKRFEVVTAPQLYPDAKGREGKFTRDPCWATFRAGNFDFTAIAVHIYYGNDSDWEKINRRRDEIEALIEVYNYVQKENENENDVILLGDFNLDPCDVNAFRPLMSLGKMKHMLHRSKHRSSMAEGKPLEERPLYDNIFFDESYLTKKEYVWGSGDDHEFDLSYTNPKRISNHLPVWAKFQIPPDDDDVDNPEDGSYHLVYYKVLEMEYHTRECGQVAKDRIVEISAIPILLEELPKDCYVPCEECKPPPIPEE